jgi:hypothetical protein
MGRFTIYMAHDLWLKFRAVCVLQNISASKQIVILIQQFLEHHEKPS